MLKLYQNLLTRMTISQQPFSGSWCITYITKLQKTACRYVYLYRNGKTFKSGHQKKTHGILTLSKNPEPPFLSALFISICLFQSLPLSYLSLFMSLSQADDDTYVIVENLRYFLSSQNSSEPIFFGHHFKTIVKQGYYRLVSITSIYIRVMS